MTAAVPESAFITVGESRKTLQAIAAGTAPSAEYAEFLKAGSFSQAIAMVDRGLDAGSMAAGMRFAMAAYMATWGTRNIYLGEEFPGIQYLALHAVMRRPKRIAMLIHNVASLRRRLPLAKLGLIRMVDHVLCLSGHSGEELESRYGVPRSKITVVGSRVDTGFFSPMPSVVAERQVCSAGAINRDYELLVRAVEPLGVSTKIAADTAWRYTAGNMSVGSLPPFVEMRSWGTYHKLRDLYAQSSVVVVPLSKALLSGVTVALEAMAMGKPVILTHNRYVEEFLREGEHGFFVPAGDVAAMRQKIEYLLDRPDEAARMGASAREWVLERFTVERYTDKILGVWN